MLGRAAVGLLTVAALTGCTHSGHHARVSSRPPGSHATGAKPGSETAAPRLTAAEATGLSRYLAAGSIGALERAVAVPAGQSIDPQAARQLAALAPITFQTSTYQAIDERTARVEGSIAHPLQGEPKTWTFTLARVGNAWKIADAEPES